MKRLTLLLALFLSFNISLTIAQEEPVPTDTIPPDRVYLDTLECGKGPVDFPLVIKSKACFKKEKYSEKEAFYRFVELLLLDLYCVDNCIPSALTCHPKYTAIPGLDKTPHTETHWCFSGNMPFSWKCTDCAEPDKSSANSDPRASAEAPDYAFSDIETPANYAGSASVNKVFPNPSDGLINLELTTDETDGRIVVKVYDLTGKVLREEIFRADSNADFLAQIDLADLNNGLYLISTFANEQLIGTSKVKIQH